MKKFFMLLVAFGLLSSCATISPEAMSVMPHRQYSNLLDGCTQLGRVNCRINNGGYRTELIREKIENALRQKAWDLYKADSVVIMDVSSTWMYGYGSGIAYRCEK